MSRPVAVLRPEPGNAATASAVERLGLMALRLPLFEARELAWHPPDPERFDALLLTSAAAIRHGGAGLAALRALPVHAVGAATARAAEAAGFRIAGQGSSDVATLLPQLTAAGVTRALHLAGREHRAAGPPIAQTVVVYAMEPLAPAPARLELVEDAVALLHSPRAAAHFAELVDHHALDRRRIRLAALSPAVATAAGAGWDKVRAAPRPDGAALLAVARLLAD